MSTPTGVTALDITADLLELDNCKEINVNDATVTGARIERMKRRGELDDNIRRNANLNRSRRRKAAKAKARAAAKATSTGSRQPQISLSQDLTIQNSIEANLNRKRRKAAEASSSAPLPPGRVSLWPDKSF